MVKKKRFPHPELPPFQLLPTLLPDIIVIAIVSFVISISIGKLFATKNNYKIVPNQVKLN
jgi:MFS superfamily sulfate permease-like transporter